MFQESLIVFGCLVLLLFMVFFIFTLWRKSLQIEKLIHEQNQFFSRLDVIPELTSAKVAPNLFQLQKEVQETLMKLNQQVSEKLFETKESQQLRFEDFRERFSKTLKDDFTLLAETVEHRLIQISDKLNENLNDGLKKTNETFNSIVERLAKIDQAQKKIEQLSQDVVSLQDVLTDKKSRGILGEVQLNHLLTTVFGENSKVFQLQFKLKTGNIADAVLFLPSPTGNIAIDSKFPLENFRRMYDQSTPEAERILARKEFKKNIQKHIDDISSKYIISGETSEQAIMFLPAEAIFAELHAYFPEVIDYANQKKVWPASPTTLMAILTTVQVVLNNMERTKYADTIHQELNKLADEFKRYRDRWNKLADHIETIGKDVRDIHITTDKITERFHRISNVDIGTPALERND